MIAANKLTRRGLLWGMSSAAAASCLAPACLGGAPTIHVKKRRKLRVLGTHVTLQEELRKQAEADLGIEISFQPGGSAAVLHQASTRPQSFDLYEQWSNSINVLWRSGAIQPIDTSRITAWDRINALPKTGSLVPDAPIGARHATG